MGGVYLAGLCKKNIFERCFFEEINEGQEEDMEHIANLIANEINEQTNGNLIQQQNEEKNQQYFCGAFF